MPSSDIFDNEAAPTKPKKAATPRRSPAVRRPANGTPTRKVATGKGDTPNSAPVRTKPSTKKTEPTLFTDFLLGRPSTNRPRRKSLDVVPMEMKRSAVGRVQPPGGVKERVKQWQKASAAAVVEDALGPPSEPDDISLDLDDQSVTERDRRRIKFRKNHTHKPGRRKSGDKEKPITPLKGVSSPRKRVVSDDHWVVNKDKKSPSRTPGTPDELSTKGQTLPKDFLKNSMNPPLEMKIGDWQKRTINNERLHKNKAAKTVPEKLSKDERIRCTPTMNASRDCEIQETTSSGKRTTIPIIEQPVHEEKTKRRQHSIEEYSSPRRRSEKHRDTHSGIKEIPTNMNPETGDVEEGSDGAFRIPTHPVRSKTRQRKSASQESLAEIPVGYSAFSVLDINGEGNETTSRPVKPQRQASLSAVPKALRKVYTEGMKKVHDTVDPPRTGVNQPPSIESWLKGTSDPFLDDISGPESIFDIPKPPPQRQSYESREVYREQDSSENRTQTRSGVGQCGKGRMLPSRPTGDTVARSRAVEPPASATLGERKPTALDARPLEQTGLKRSPATRNASSPKNIRHPLPKDIFVDSYDQEPQLEAHTASPRLYANGLGSSSTARKTKDLPVISLDASNPESNDLRQACLSSRGSQLHDAPVADLRDLPEVDQYNAASQGDSCATGQRRLSTVVSVETFKTSSSLTERSSELSDTTITRTTVTQDLSTTSNTSGASDTSQGTKEPIKGLGLKGRITTHSDLLSVLSLQENSALGKKKSIRSACSVRTNRTRLATATIPDLLRELADDEAKYMKELKTLVDGVIPVLLTCVLSKADTAVAAGLFDRSSSGQTDALITKPIIDMGIALEQLKTLHKRIPLHDPDLLVHWAVGAHKVYEDYVNAWRMGFQNVVVNLAPASQSESAEAMSLDEVPRNTDGDVLNENGERVDVAFLLKRPLLRVKYLAKLIKGILTIQPKEQVAIINNQYQDLLAKIRRRTREEEARLEDQAASSTDSTRARDLRTLDPIEGVVIDVARQVYAKDFFDFRLLHSSGQRIDCRVELIFRDKPLDKSDAGDLLICEVDSIDRWLLFPPIISNMVSARAGDAKQELIVMIRGGESSRSWEELFTLRATDDETAAEWLQMLGLSPSPPHLQRLEAPSIPAVLMSDPDRSGEALNNRLANQISSSVTGLSESDVPIGERRIRSTRLQLSKADSEQRKASVGQHSPLSSHYDSPTNETGGAVSKDLPKDLNDAMEHAGRMVNSDLRRARAKRHNSHDLSKWPAMPSLEDLNTNSNSDHQRRSKRAPPPRSPCSKSSPEDVCIATPQISTPKTSLLESTAIPREQKQLQTNTNEHGDLPLEDSTRSKISSPLVQSGSPKKGVQEVSNIAPTPPPHKALSPISLKTSPSSAMPTPTAKSRRFSSPLKHEYQPSDESGFSSAAVDLDQEDLQNSSDSSEEELEAAENTIPPNCHVRRRSRLSPALSFSISPDASLAPSNSASQAPFNGDRISPSADTTKSIATISCWSEKGRWIDLHSEDCTIIVGPGLIEAYTMKMFPDSSDVNSWSDDGLNSPLVSLELTPIVPLRQSNAVDIEIRSPPTAKSSVECTHTVRFRSHTLEECSTLYAAIHKARMKNPVYMALEQERIVGAYGKQILETAGGNRRHSWFGRSKSYRASIRAPSDAVSDNSSNSLASAISRLKNMGILGSFNIDKSSVGTSQGITSGTSSGATSAYTDTASSGNTSRTPSSPSTAMTGASKLASFGSQDLKIRLYLSVSPSKWSDIGAAFLTISHPPRGMRQASSLYHGVEKRIVVTKQESAKRTLVNKFQGATSPKGDESTLQTVLDIVLGGACFSRQGVVGIVMNVWEDVRGDNGEVGRVAAIGGVSGKTRRWMFHFASAAETAWVFSLVGGGVR